MSFNKTTPVSNSSGGLINSELTKFGTYGESAGQVLKLFLLISVIAVFIFLISRDILKALKRRAHWIPGDFLVLSAFTIQLLNLLSTQGQPLDVSTDHDMRWNEFWMVHTSRVMLCVIVAYLMPGMANPRAEESWGKLMALALTVFLHVSSEYNIVRRNHNDGQSDQDESYYCSVSGCLERDKINMTLYIVFATLISLCFVMLLLLLGCANIAGRGIERILVQEIPLLLKDPWDMNSESGEKATHAHHDYHSCCRTVEKAVLMAEERKKDLPHDHSCWQTVKVEVTVERANTEDQDHRQIFLERVEDVVREKVEALYQHSCWRTVDDALLRAKKAEDEHHHRHCQHCWRMVEDAVLRNWIVARAYSLEYIIARSALVSSAAIIVTTQIVITIIGGVRIQVSLRFDNMYDKLRFTATVLQCVFILIGWLVIEWRWVTAVAYYRRWKESTWRSDFRIEDFWTRHLRELLQAQKPKLRQKELLESKVNRIVAKEQIAFTVPRILLCAVVVLQWVTVAFSKACWLASLMIFHNRVMSKLLSFILSMHETHALEDYKKYEEMLKGLQMLKRSPKTLWVANRKSITKAKNLILRGNEDGEFMCEILFEFLINKRTGRGVGLSCLEPYKPQTGLNFLCKKKPPNQQPQEERDVENQPPQQDENWSLIVEEHFADVSTKSWKMTAVSLLSMIIHLAPIYAELDKEDCSTSHDFPPKAVTDCMEAYSQAWEIVDFVEETDTESNFNISEAADRYLDILQRKLKKGSLIDSTFRHATPQCVRAALEDLKRECQSKTEPPGGVNMISAEFYALGVKKKKNKRGSRLNRWENFGGNDSFDWEKAAYGNAVYKLCNSIHFDDDANMEMLLKELESSLADIINECLEKFQNLLLLNSKKWARNSDEKRMGKALYTAGKARLIMQNLDMKSEAIVPVE